ncbi:MAG: TolC family protein [Aureispira sp.]|nr:TolC family protein [Aureispira sp.]
MRKLYWLLCVFLLSPYLMQAQDGEAFSLEDAVNYAERNSNEVKDAALDVAHSKAQVKEYVSIGIPKISAKVEYNYFLQIPTQLIPAETFAPPGAPIPPGEEYIEAQFGTKNNLTGSVTLSSLVFDGSYFVGLKASKGLLEMTKRQADLTRHNIKYPVQKAYLTVLIAIENRAVLVNNISNIQKMLDETIAYFENGLVEQLDVERLELSKANLETELSMVDRQVELAHNVLKFQMNYPIDQKITLTDKLETLLKEVPKEDLEGDIDFKNRIELDVLQRSEHLNNLNVKRYQMGYLPSLSAFAMHQQQLQRDNLFDNDAPGFFPTTIIGATLNIPIFDGLEKSAKIQKTKIERDKISLQIKDFKRGTELEVTNARAVYINAKQRLASQEKNVALAEKILGVTKTKYKEGVGSSLEITQAEQELYRTQANYMNALYDVVAATVDLNKSLGK